MCVCVCVCVCVYVCVCECECVQVGVTQRTLRNVNPGSWRLVRYISINKSFVLGRKTDLSISTVIQQNVDISFGRNRLTKYGLSIFW